MLTADNGFNALFNNPFLGNILLDAQMRIVQFNETAQKNVQQFFGMELKEGTSLLLYVNDDARRDGLIVNFHKALTGVPVRADFELTDTTGKPATFVAIYTPICGAEGQTQTVCFSYYLTEERLEQTPANTEKAAKQEKIIRTLFEHQPHASVLLSPEGKTLYINRKAVILFRKFNLPIEKDTSDVFIRLKSSPLQEIAAIAKEVLQSGTAVVVERELLDAVDKKYWLEFSLVPVSNTDGSILGLYLQIRDTGLQRQTEELMRLQQERLRHSESQLRAIFDSSSDINIFIGPDYRIISFNKEAVDTYLQQHQKRLLPGLDMRTLAPEGFKENFEANFQMALKGKPITNETEIANYLGERQWYRFSYTPVIDRLGNTIGVIINAINITERKQNEEKILRQNEQIREFAFLTAHRLRAPVASILGLIKVFELDTEMSREDMNDIVRRLKTATEELNHAVNAMNRSLEPLQINQSAENYMSSVAVINDSARPTSIMLIDDDPIVNMVSKTLLQRNYPGIVIHTFLKAEDALQFLKTSKDHPALILLDVVMPEMNGWQFLDEFEKLPEKPPVCMLSSSLRKSDHEEAKKYSSVIDFIIKPLDTEKIKTVMQFLKISQ